MDVIKAKIAPYLRAANPHAEGPMINDDDYTIVATYGAKYRGIVQYYLLAGDVYRLHRLRWVMETSMLKTLAGKHRSTVSKMAASIKAKIVTPHGPRTCFEATYRTRRQAATGRTVRGYPTQAAEDGGHHRPRAHPGRLPAQGAGHPAPRGPASSASSTATVQVHHVRKLADLGQPGQPQPQWAKAMATTGAARPSWSARSCHDAIHAGQPTPPLTQ